MKKRTLNITALFFAAMLILTFCSRTIYRSTMTKVQTIKPSSGTLKYSIETQDFDICADLYDIEYIPFEFEHSLTITKIMAKPGQLLEIGDPLVSFYAPEGERLLAQAESDLLAARDLCSVFDVALAESIASLDEELNVTQNSDMRNVLLKKRNLLYSGILNNESTRNVYASLRSAQAQADYLRKLAKDAWTLRASSSGILCSIDVDINDTYIGIAPLCHIAKSDMPVYINAKLNNAPDTRRGKWNKTVFIDTSNGLVAGEIRTDDASNVYFNVPENVELSEIISVVINLESPYEQILVPNSAIENDKVFILDTDKGSWGQIIYRAKEVSIKKGNADLQNTAITDGIDRNDIVIVNSTGDLKTGQIVLLDSYE